MILFGGAIWLLALTALTLGWKARERKPDAIGRRPPVVVRLLCSLPIPGGLCETLAAMPRLPGASALSADLERGRASAALVPASFAGLPLVGTGIVGLVAPVVVGGLGLLGFDAWAISRSRQRHREILRALPDVLDTVSVATAAGVGIGEAFRLAAEAAGGPIADELARADGELHLGVSRRDALSELARRIDLPEIRRAVGAVRDGEELGVPLSDVLAGQARAVRIARREEVRIRAATAAPKIQLVVALTMVPAAMVLVLGVLVLNLASQVGAALG